MLTSVEPSNSEKRHRRRRSIIHEFCLNTSTHALPGIARSLSWHNRLFWSISFACASGLMLFLIVQSIRAYLAYPTQIGLDIVTEWPQYFPAFSFCNVGILRFDQFFQPFVDFMDTLNLTNTNDTSTWTPAQASYMMRFILFQFNANRSMEPFFYSLPSMLYRCSYNGQPCSASDFIPFTSTYGSCYTFNARLKNTSEDSLRYGNENGGAGKLELGLYVHSHQYVPYLSDGIGMVVLVHDNMAVPLMDLFGLNLIPGRKHKLSYRKTATYFLPAPYTICTNTARQSTKAISANYPGADYRYSQMLCFRMSVQSYTFQRCGCANPFIWDIRSIVLPGATDETFVPLCNVTDPCYVSAANDFQNSSPDQNNAMDGCPQSCSTVDFPVALSALLAPVEWEMPLIKRFVENTSVPLPPDWSSAWRDHIHRNYLSISVEREKIVVENNTQSATLTLVDVLSNIGGQTGLWIGISVLSIMELIEMLYRLLRHQWRVIRPAQQIRPQ